MMNMDNHCKNVCLIGILNIVGYIIFSVDPLLNGINIINSCDVDENWSSKEAFAEAGCFIFIAILAFLMVLGVVKQRHLLMAPFLVINTIGLIFLMSLFLMRLTIEYQLYYFYPDCLYSIGVQIMILYPTYTLFSKLRAKSLKEKSLEVKPSKQEIKAVDV